MFDSRYIKAKHVEVHNGQVIVYDVAGQHKCLRGVCHAVAAYWENDFVIVKINNGHYYRWYDINGPSYLLSWMR